MKRSRVALLAAAQLCWGGFACHTAMAGSVSSVWSDLWRTPDQQGEALLAAGEPGAAAARFQDPRRRAYAELEAGRYPEAARLLAPFTDPQSEYNRGNALARSGRLREALAAYDAALKQEPTDRDIRHNRDLVERALRQQRRSARSQGQQGGQRSGPSGQQQSSAGRRSGSGSQRPGSGSQSSAGGSPTAANGSGSGANRSGDNNGAQDSGPTGSPRDSGAQQSAGAHGSNSPREASAQAKRDAALAAALARAQQQRRGAGNTGQAQGSQPAGTSAPGSKSAPNGSLLMGGGQTPQQKPETERQLALDQWLRQIPASPAGLLQRKFLIEHMLRQQDGDDARGAGQ